MMWSRIVLIIATCLLFVATSSTISKIIGVSDYLKETASIEFDIIAFCLLALGIIGSFITLLFSKKLAIRKYNLEIIPEDTSIPEFKGLLAEVRDLSRKAAIKNSPEVAIYDSEEVNAFATGPTKENSMIALSTGLLSSMNTNQIRAVIAHEIGHISSGDMVTMAILQGIICSINLVLSKLILSSIEQRIKNNYLIILIQNLILSIMFLFGSIIVFWFSRRREYRADLISAELTSPETILDTLKFLNSITEKSRYDSSLPAKLIGYTGFIKPIPAFDTHPNISDRINSLRIRYKII